MIDTLKNFFKHGLNFKERTSRGNYWITVFGLVIFTFIIEFFVIGFIGGVISDILGIILSCIFSIVISIPMLSLSVRRLHDVNKSGWYLFVGFIPIVGIILLITALCSKTIESNKYGKQV
ncbi:MAG: DUF805 domain-containing protein [Bacilli bacterium]|nr:DUF805 domain-containing protein [Bacilli bacterium]